MLVSAFIAGLASVLSPCILPLLPLIFVAATAQHRFGAVALACGLALSYALIGAFIALAGYGIGFDEDRFRLLGALGLVILGCVIAVPAAERKFSSFLIPVGNWFATRSANIAGTGLSGQFVLGVLLGAAWGPCVGPTLGLASAMAMRGENLLQAGLVLCLFSVGASLPLLLIGVSSREALFRWRGSFLTAGRATKTVLGVMCIVIGASILAGIDRQAEAVLASLYPEWLLGMTTQY